MATVEIPYGYCHCGCGQKTNISKYTSARFGWTKGEPRKFLAGHEARLRGRENLAGMKFGRWTAISFSHLDNNRSAHWLCECECGTRRTVRASQLKNGTNRSCGCLQRELTAKKSYRHGLSGHPLRGTYYQMRARCYNQNSAEYSNYGGRGIAVCDRWMQGFKNFLDDMGERPEGHTLDRIDNNGPYSPDNCRWATDSEQCNNTRLNHVLDLNGKRQTVVQWAAELGIHTNTIRSRMRYGWPVERVLDPRVDTRCRHNSTNSP